MPTKEATSRQDRRKAQTRARIIDAAAEIFATDPAAATIARIAQEADVAVATVYQHFAGKDDLHLAVVERALERNEQHMMTVYLADTPPLQKLINAAAAYVAFYVESPQLFRLVALRQGAPTEESTEGPVAVILSERVNRMTQALADVIEAGVADGSLRSVEPLATARFLWGAMNGTFALAARPDQLRLTHDELIAALSQGLDIVLEGFVAPSTRDSDGHLPKRLRMALRRAIKDVGAPGAKQQ
ncbi:TetR/AcrR family transcriptional regulator [Luteipulveratus mongoliensis]|uniref:TetR/AcrR family transcriptional regulator n=1 Tax=Luteipulveratus mongoliensis TaxID=571913 RepID=UPI000695FDC5|nr:TetR/AcrR family transcriptional regulator [Luteipulveratus mongoliensis]